MPSRGSGRKHLHANLRVGIDKLREWNAKLEKQFGDILKSGFQNIHDIQNESRDFTQTDKRCQGNTECTAAAHVRDLTD